MLIFLSAESLFLLYEQNYKKQKSHAIFLNYEMPLCVKMSFGIQEIYCIYTTKSEIFMGIIKPPQIHFTCSIWIKCYIKEILYL